MRFRPCYLTRSLVEGLMRVDHFALSITAGLHALGGSQMPRVLSSCSEPNVCPGTLELTDKINTLDYPDEGES